MNLYNWLARISNITFLDDFQKEQVRLRKMPRYTETSTTILGEKIIVPDAASYLSMNKEIFLDQCYRFISKRADPFIVDCGANIGLSVIYFKQLYPDSKIVAFEPDGKIFDILKQNIRKFSCQDVLIVNKAVWDREDILTFYPEGADAGRLTDDSIEGDIIPVEAVRLKPYLERHVDFLKIDIEGAEYRVLKDCEELLCNVDNIFVEYHSFVGKKQKLDKILRILLDSGFRLHFHPIALSKQPFVNIKTFLGMDAQVNIFGIRS